MRVGKGLLSVFLSIVLVVGLCPGLAYADDGGGIAAGSVAGAPTVQAFPTAQSSEGIAYDTVYGVVGGEYSLMMKTVEYEVVEDGVTEQRSATISDIVRTDGQVVLHTSTADNENKAIPGVYTDLKMIGFDTNWGEDPKSRCTYITWMMANGYVAVASKATGKKGLKRLNGSTLAPCEFEYLGMYDDGYPFGVKFEGHSAFVTLMKPDGGIVETFTQDIANFPASSVSVWTNQMISRELEITLNCDGSLLPKIIFCKGASGWVCVTKLGYTKVVEPNNMGEFLGTKTDGAIYYRGASGEEVKIDKADNYWSYSLNGDFVILTTKDDSNGWTSSYDSHFFNKVGTKLPFGPFPEDSYMFLGYGYVMHEKDENWDESGDYPVSTYDVYDASGQLHRSFSGCGVEALNGRYGAYGDTRYTLNKPVGDGAYELCVLDFDGTLIKSLGVQDCWYAKLCEVYSAYGGGMIGYQRIGEWGAEDVFYDLDFNRLSGDPRGTDSDPAPNALRLADGTIVLSSANVSYEYDGNGNVVWSFAASVKDAQGQVIVRNGRKLTVADDAASGFGGYNSVKHGNADVWWAQDASGKFGAIDSYGNVKVPFAYDSYYDAGNEDTDYAMVKKDGAWGFYRLPVNSVPGATKGGSPSSDKPTVSGAQKPATNAGTTANSSKASGKDAAIAPAASAKSANPLKVKAKTVTLKAKKLKKKAQSVKMSKAFKVTGAKGKVTFKVSKYDKKAKKKIVVSKAGKVTAKKGLKKGTYKLKVKVAAAGDASHRPAAKTVTLKVKVK